MCIYKEREREREREREDIDLARERKKRVYKATEVMEVKFSVNGSLARSEGRAQSCRPRKRK